LRQSIPPVIKEGQHESKTETHKSVKKQEAEDDEDEDYYKYYDYNNEDLNQLETDELKKRKGEMDKLYEKNAIKPENDDFVYDIRVYS
jgi:hypothetical protein